ncbi:hypothetical protein HY373_02285 [Candidatus Berkelbacteria bacterium]|nr:hypothetical protein [Candidatus Berkelbacteria bacterium]
MERTIELVMKARVFNLSDLIWAAAVYKGISDNLQGWLSHTYHWPVKEYTLDARLLAILAERGIRQQDCFNDIFTLVDENFQERIQGRAMSFSGYWNFGLLEDQGEFDLRVRLSVEFEIGFKNCGIAFVPEAQGSYPSSPNRLSHFWMFKALIESDNNDVPDVAKELAASNGSIVVTWAELGLDGIRSVVDLFQEFAGEEEAVVNLGRNKKVFNPYPLPLYQLYGDRLFIPKPTQPEIFRVWRAQLNEYRDRLVV